MHVYVCTYVRTHKHTYIKTVSPLGESNIYNKIENNKC